MSLDSASPEQVRGDPITTATDVYSLGVLLYRLLTGKAPYGNDVRTQAALQHAICEREPMRPSAQVLSDEKTAVPEATQKMEALDESRDKARKRLRKKLAGDLDNIILMALRKEPHRRYLSAEQFSEDIERYLNGQPVIARLDTPGYQLAKYVRRNGEGVAAAIVIGAALISIAAVSQRTARDAVAEWIVEDGTLEQTRHELVAAYLKGGDTSRAVDVARIAYTANRGDALARRDFAVAATALGDELVGRADRAGATALYSEALTHYDAVAQMNTRDVSAQRDVMLAAQKLGDLQAQDGNLSGALTSFRRALQIAQTLAALEGEQISQATQEELAGANRRVTEITK